LQEENSKSMDIKELKVDEALFRWDMNGIIILLILYY
jgi:hypothetical protein